MSYPHEKEAGALAAAISAACAGIGDCTLGFSGGLDSALLALHLKGRCCGYVCGVPDAPDVRAAMAAAALLDIPLYVVELDESLAERILGEIGERVGTNLSPVEAAILIPYVGVCMRMAEDTVVTGQGADELFGGYAKYLKGDAAGMMRSDLESVLQKGAGFERVLASSFGKVAVHPYLDQNVMEAASLPSEAHFWRDGRKMLLRAAARRSGLPEVLVEMPKKAAQYGSGATKLVARLAKREGLSVGAYVERALRNW